MQSKMFRNLRARASGFTALGLDTFFARGLSQRGDRLPRSTIFAATFFAIANRFWGTGNSNLRLGQEPKTPRSRSIFGGEEMFRDGACAQNYRLVGALELYARTVPDMAVFLR
jgi:hypothetical protein